VARSRVVRVVGSSVVRVDVGCVVHVDVSVSSGVDPAGRETQPVTAAADATDARSLLRETIPVECR